jgi:hypothetical protein
MAIEVVGPDGTILEFPEGTSREVMRAAMAKRYPKNAAAPKPKAKAKPKKSFLKRAEEFGEAALTGVAEGIRPVSEFAQRLDPTRPVFEAVQDIVTPGARQANERRFRQQVERVKRESPNTFTGGKIVGEIVATAPIAGAAGAGIKAVGGKLATRAPAVGRSLQRVGRAVQTGGLGTGRTAAQTAALSKGARAAQLAERMAGGAISGAITTGAVGGDVGEGALFGAGLPVVANVLKRVGGKVVDLTRLPKLKAAEIIRESLGENLDEARAAFAQLSPDDQRLARQVLIEADIEPDTFMGLGADVERLRPEQTRRVLEGQAAAREAALADISGGATATQRRGAAETGRRAVSEATGPAREAALERANVAGRAVPAAERLASAALARADEMTASGFVPRMRGLEERSRGQIDAVFQNPEFFTQGGPVNRIGEIAEGAGQRADDAITAQIGLRQQARDMEDVVADLAAEGMQPLQVAPIVSEIRRMANAPATRISTLQRRALTKAANQLEAAQDANGVIDARDLYQFRKSELGDIINVLMSARNQPPSGVKEAAAGKMADVRKIIDDAIESAGGTGFKDYLVRTRQGFEAVNRQELAAEGARLAKKSPDEFIALMGGERPQIVEDIMGKGTKQYDIGGMALMDPRRYNTMMGAARELQSLNRMRELGQSGATVANELIGRERPFLARNLTRMGLAPFPPARIATEGGEMALAALMRPRVRDRLANAFVSGQGMREAMEQYPTAFNISEQVSRAPAGLRNVMAQGLVRPITADFPEIDPETGEILLEVGFNEDGSTYPIYGRPPAR